MSKIRFTTIDSLHSKFCILTKDWSVSAGKEPIDRYILKHGIFHLLIQNRQLDAKSRMLELHFMAEFADAWPTFVEPLKAWRLIGLDLLSAHKWHIDYESFSCDRAAYFVCDFLLGAGLSNASVTLAREVLKVYPDNINLRMILGISLRQGGMWNEAILVNKEILSRYGDILDEKTFFQIQYNINNNLSDLDKRTSTDSKSTMTMAADLFGAESETYWNSRESYALDLANEDSFTEAVSVQKEVVHWSEKIFGLNHPYTLGRYSNMATILSSFQKHDEALQFYQAYRNGTAELYGHDHPDTLTAMGGLATCLSNLDMNDKAKELFLKVLHSRQKKLGEMHPKTLTSLLNLAIFLHRQIVLEDCLQLSDEALRFYEKAFIGHMETHGCIHRQTIHVANSYAMLLHHVTQTPKKEVTQEWLRKIQVYESTHNISNHVHWRLAGVIKKLNYPVQGIYHRRCCWEIECIEDGLSASGTLQTAFALVEDLIEVGESNEALFIVESSLNAVSEIIEDKDQKKWIEQLKIIASNLQ